MIDNKGKIRCDREIGGYKPKPHWHGCNALATSVVEGFDNMVLHYCDKHVQDAVSEGRQFVKAIQQ